MKNIMLSKKSIIQEKRIQVWFLKKEAKGSLFKQKYAFHTHNVFLNFHCTRGQDTFVKLKKCLTLDREIMNLSGCHPSRLLKPATGTQLAVGLIEAGGKCPSQPKSLLRVSQNRPKLLIVNVLPHIFTRKISYICKDCIFQSAFTLFWLL